MQDERFSTRLIEVVSTSPVQKGIIEVYVASACMSHISVQNLTPNSFSEVLGDQCACLHEFTIILSLLHLNIITQFQFRDLLHQIVLLSYKVCGVYLFQFFMFTNSLQLDLHNKTCVASADPK